MVRSMTWSGSQLAVSKISAGIHRNGQVLVIFSLGRVFVWLPPSLCRSQHVRIVRVLVHDIRDDFPDDAGLPLMAVLATALECLPKVCWVCIDSSSHWAPTLRCLYRLLGCVRLGKHPQGPGLRCSIIVISRRGYVWRGDIAVWRGL